MPSVVQGKPGVRLVISGARGRQGAGSGALGSDSVDADKLVSTTEGKAAILEKLGLGAPVATITEKTIGTGQDFANLSTAWVWALLRDVRAALTFRIVGEIDQAPISLAHKDARNIYITGDTLTGDMPTVDDMTLVEADNIDEIKTRIPSAIRVISGGGNLFGIGVPGEFGGINKVFIYHETTADLATIRYLLAVGQFQNSYSDAKGHAALALGEVAVYGGVWSFWGRGNGYATQSAACFYGGCADGSSTPSGAPLGVEAGFIYRRAPTTPLDLFAPGCQYGAYERFATLELDGETRIAGASTSRCECGVYGRGGYVSAVGVVVAGCESIALFERGCTFDLSEIAASGCDADASTFIYEVDPGNAGAIKALVAAGMGCVGSVRDFDFTGVAGAHLFYTGPGGIIVAAGGTTTGHDLSNSVATAAGLMGGIDLSNVTIASPTGGSATAVNARRGAFIDINGISGTVTASPSADTNAQGLGKVIDQ